MQHFKFHVTLSAICAAHFSLHGSTELFLWMPPPAQRSLSEVHYILPMFFLIYFFYGRLILRPRLMEVRETFTRGGP